MTRRPEEERTSLLARALLAAVTTAVAVLAWQGFTEDFSRTAGPVLVVAVTLGGTGAALRAARCPRLLVVAAQLLVGGVVCLGTVTGRWLPTPEALAALEQAVRTASASASQYAAPVPADVPGIHPLLVPAGAAVALLVDVLAETLRRVALAGLPLLLVQAVPVSMLGSSGGALVFSATAAGYLAMLALDHRDRVREWQRVGPRSPLGAAHGVGLAALGVVTALVVAAVLPTTTLAGLPGPGSAGSGDIEIENPLADLRRDLRRPADVPLLTVRSEQRPTYVRLTTLTRFSGATWSSGDRDLPQDRTATGALPPPPGLREDAPRREVHYEYHATERFRSVWLPTPQPASSVRAGREWKFDPGTRDFLATGGQTTAGRRWSATGLEITRDPQELAGAPAGTSEVTAGLSQLPDDLPPIVADLAEQVTESTDNRFASAVALQQWFREDGGFTYSLERSDTGSGNEALAEFLSPEGRVGYCEQYASAMAVMARSLGIPARVSIGFLTPERTGPGTWQFSGHDLHAWPELYFPGSGWVRFEPTPPQRAQQTPAYTQDPAQQQPDDQTGPQPAPRGAQPAPQPAPQQPAAPQPGQQGGSDGRDAATPVWPWVAGAVVLLGAVVVLLAPRVRRTRRHRRRWTTDSAEAAWAELADTVADLGLDWPRCTTPRQAGEALQRQLTDPEGRTRVARVVAAVEQERYAPDPATVDVAAVRDDVAHVTAQLRSLVPRAQRRRARWFPASLRGGLRTPGSADDVASAPPSGRGSRAWAASAASAGDRRTSASRPGGR